MLLQPFPFFILSYIILVESPNTTIRKNERNDDRKKGETGQCKDKYKLKSETEGEADLVWKDAHKPESKNGKNYSPNMAIATSL